MSVRVRYAPSPTGSPHVGNIRTALFCHLFARQQGGVNTLRIEDTDRTRYVEGCEDEIVESLQWIGVDYQEGPDKGGPHAPYRQSERAAQGIYDHWINALLEKGHAYWAFDTPEELTEMREFQTINKQPVGYFGGQWRDASAEQVAEARTAGKPGVIRLKMPRGRTLVVNDAIRGRVEFEAETSDDPVLIKGDGMPTYHFAAMVDDHLMGTTHIIRGEEWISSAPKHVWLFEAFGWETPMFVHVPVIKGTDGSKLSKRHGDTRCLDYRSAGYLPEALANFIALIGWSPGGDRELMSMADMEDAFSLSGLQASPGVFDPEKLNWMNGHYIRALDADDFVRRVESYVNAADTDAYWGARPEDPKGKGIRVLQAALAEDPSYAHQVIKLDQERVTTLADLGPALDFFFVEHPPLDEKAKEKWLTQPHAAGMLADFATQVEAMAYEPDVAACEKIVRDYAAAHGFEKLGPVVHPLRVKLTGRTVGPGLFELMAVLGRERMVKRLRA